MQFTVKYRDKTVSGSIAQTISPDYKADIQYDQEHEAWPPNWIHERLVHNLLEGAFAESDSKPISGSFHFGSEAVEINIFEA